MNPAPASSAPAVLTIGGLDPSGGAGILTDSLTFAAFSPVHGMAAVTAVTAQSLDRCNGVFPVSAVDLCEQLESISCHSPHSIKVGLLGSAENARVIAKFLRDHSSALRVVDPVLASSSGHNFTADETLRVLMEDIFPHADVVTPNLPEVSALLGRSIANDAISLIAAARELRSRGPRVIVIKGGHRFDAADAAHSIDLVVSETEAFFLISPRFQGETRGTGCCFAAAIAAAFAAKRPDEDLVDALVCAKAYVTGAIRRAHIVGASQRKALHHAPWAPSEEDFPRLSGGQNLSISSPEAFPSTGAEPLGFYPIVDRADWLERLLPLGVTTVQIRAKDLKDEALAKELKAAVVIAQKYCARLFINDHWRAAIELGAYGVHLGQEDLAALSPTDWQKLRSSGIRLGISTHSYEELARALALSPSYIALGPIFPTTLKSMRFAPQGEARVRTWRTLTALPLVAIGGIKLQDASSLLAAGADSIAVVSDITQHPNPERRTKDWLNLFQAPK